jgi:SCY1-like protein 1
MDFLKSAVASAMAKGPPFPYSFGDKVDVDESMWTLTNGTKKVGMATFEDASSLPHLGLELTLCSIILGRRFKL